MPHTAKSHCDKKHCKIHWIWSFKLKNHVKYPEQFNILSSRLGWLNVNVYCGPGAYLPKKPTDSVTETTTSHVPPF